MTLHAHTSTDSTRRRRARTLLLVLVFMLGKGMPMPAMAAEQGQAIPMAPAAHCTEMMGHATNDAGQASHSSSELPQTSHANCCTSESGTCALHCAMSLPLSIPRIALEPALTIPDPVRLLSLVSRSLSPPQRPPKV